MTPYVSPCPYCGISYPVEWSGALPGLPPHPFYEGDGTSRPCNGGGKPLELEGIKALLARVAQDMESVTSQRDAAAARAVQATASAARHADRLRELEREQDALLLALEKL